VAYLVHRAVAALAKQVDQLKDARRIWGVVQVLGLGAAVVLGHLQKRKKTPAVTSGGLARESTSWFFFSQDTSLVFPRFDSAQLNPKNSKLAPS